MSTANNIDTSKSHTNNPALGTTVTDMGGGSSRKYTISVDGRQLTEEKVRQMFESYRHQLVEKDRKLEETECELRETQKKVEELEDLIHLLRQQLSIEHPTDGKPLLEIDNKLSQLTLKPPAVPSRSKKQGVSGESGNQKEQLQLKHYPKEDTAKDLIRSSLEKNDFLSRLEAPQVAEMVQCMYERNIPANCYIIREGESGEHLYVCAEGEFEVTKDNKLLGKMGPGRSFGELALLYNCSRTASVKAVTNCRVWVLDGRVFRAIMMKTGLEKQEETLKFLKSVELLKRLPLSQMSKLADVLEVQFHEPEECIIRQGEAGNSFFIIQSGRVKVTQKVEPNKPPVLIREMGRGEYFGEKALLNTEPRTANVYALEPGVEVLCLYRKDFLDLVGNLDELKNKEYADSKRYSNEEHSEPSPSVPATPVKERPFQNIEFKDLHIVATLGMGGFGRVELVTIKKDKTKSFALKCLKKKHIVDTRQQEHIKSERSLLLQLESNFICRLYKTYKDKKYVYLLMEVCLGGEMWTILRDRGHLDENGARFTLACVIEAFHYLHKRFIIYRDLKPENLLVDGRGYVKLCDFGFAKKIGPGRKTWTFCGTPEYVAPEIILNKGHDFTCDYWSLGILTFELSTGTPPFTTNDPMKTYNLILKGMDTVDIAHNKRISSKACQLIRKLCRQNPSDRLGNGKGGVMDIKTNKFFQGFDWEGLAHLSLNPPFKPKISSPSDHSNFDKFPKDSEIPPDETSGWDEDF